MAAPLIRLERATFGYAGHPVLREATLTFSAGEFVGIVGPNGSGKSTLMRGLLGLLKPLSGRVIRSPALGRAVGWVPQRDTIDAVFPMTALDVARLGRALVSPWHRPLSAHDETLARRALDTVGLSSKSTAPFATLSGGQRQRALIARALATEPRLLVLDEPTAGVDPKAEEAILSLLRALHKDEGLSIVLVTHHHDSLPRVATRVVEVHEGRVKSHLGKMP